MVEKVQRKVRIHLHQEVVPDLEPIQEGFPMRRWSIDIHLLNAEGQAVPARVFDKVTYKLHPTFANPVRTLTEPPFQLQETGWGEFLLQIVFTIVERGGEQTVSFDLTFAAPDTTKDAVLNFPLNKPGLVALLAESGPVQAPSTSSGRVTPSPSVSGGTPGQEKRSASEGLEGDKQRAKRQKAVKGSVDLEKLAQGLEKLGEQDILSIVQMVSDNKTTDMFVKNDVERGEFQMDLFTMPNALLKSMWEYVTQRVDVA